MLLIKNFSKVLLILARTSGLEPPDASSIFKLGVFVQIMTRAKSAFSTTHLQCPFGVQRQKPYEEAEGRASAKREYGMGSDGNQKCPSMFFILRGYIETVYIYLYIYSKIAANILIGFKI